MRAILLLLCSFGAAYSKPPIKTLLPLVPHHLQDLARSGSNNKNRKREAGVPKEDVDRIMISQKDLWGVDKDLRRALSWDKLVEYSNYTFFDG